MTEEIRKLVTIKPISKLTPIPGADAIETAHIGGWTSVVKKGDFTPGQAILFFEIDSFLPENVEEFKFLMARGVRTVKNLNGDDATGVVLGTMKLRKQLSQGLVIPLAFGLTEDSTQSEINQTMETIGVFKYEPPLPESGNEIAAFPSMIRKTSSERVQNLSDEFLASQNPNDWFASEKIDGISSTFWVNDGELHGAGRNWELNLAINNLHSQIAEKYNLANVIPEGGIIQGEIYGLGAPKNILKQDELKLAVFSHSFMKMTPESEETLAFDAWVKAHSAPLVPLEFPTTVEQAVNDVYGIKSVTNPNVYAEGVVWWHKAGELFSELSDRSSFKVISNKYLEKHG